jgi:hypothetical protein
VKEKRSGKDGAYWKRIGRGHREGGKEINKISSREQLLNQKQHRDANKIIHGHVPMRAKTCNVGDRPHRGGEPWGGARITDGRILPRELLDNGQGKSVSSDMEISSCSEGEEQSPEVMRTSTGGREEALGRFFLPPVIEATGILAMGATTESLRKQNKHQQTKALLRQPITSQ